MFAGTAMRILLDFSSPLSLNSRAIAIERAAIISSLIVIPKERDVFLIV